MIRKIVIGKPKSKKKPSNKELSLYEKERQIKNINMLFLGERFAGCDDMIKVVKKKISGYKSQDVKKGRLDKSKFISYEDTLEKLVVSKLQCHYCRDKILIMYTDKREKMQWTLDRLDNSLCHSKENTVICCLGCNLQKRCRDEKKFMFTKQMRLIKEN